MRKIIFIYILIVGIILFSGCLEKQLNEDDFEISVKWNDDYNSHIGLENNHFIHDMFSLDISVLNDKIKYPIYYRVYKRIYGQYDTNRLELSQFDDDGIYEGNVEINTLWDKNDKSFFNIYLDSIEEDSEIEVIFSTDNFINKNYVDIEDVQILKILPSRKNDIDIKSPIQIKQNDTTLISTSTLIKTSTQNILKNEDIINSINVKDFKYISTNGLLSSIGAIGGTDKLDASFSFILTYLPTSTTQEKNIYYSLFVSNPNDDWSSFAGYPILLKYGDNQLISELYSTINNLNDAPKVKLCFSYDKDKLLLTDNELKESILPEGVICVDKIFNSPNIKVQITPSNIKFDLKGDIKYTNQVLSNEQKITITNIGNVPQKFYLFVPSEHDGTNRKFPEQPKFTVISNHEAFLYPYESYTYIVNVNAISSTSKLFSDTAYIYTVPHNLEAYYLASSYQNAEYKKPFVIKTLILK